jgi:hypothetical protein
MTFYRSTHIGHSLKTMQRSELGRQWLEDRQPMDLLADSTPSNHPATMLIMNNHYAKDLVLDSDAFAFSKPSNEVPNLAGVTLHLAFAAEDLLDDLIASSKNASIESVSVKSVTAQSVLLARSS